MSKTLSIIFYKNCNKKVKEKIIKFTGCPTKHYSVARRFKSRLISGVI